MSQVNLQCRNCQVIFDYGMDLLHCRYCDVPLDVQYNGEKRTYVEVSGYQVRMPFDERTSLFSLGEGNTPVIELSKLGSFLGLDRLRAKLEFMNPTGSYKDRGTAVMLTVARELGVTEIVEDSSGNAGASVSAYAARAGIKCHIFAPATAPAAKIKQIRVYGAEVHSIEGTRDDTTNAAVDFYKKEGLVYASHAWSPFFSEGTKTFTFEVIGQYNGEVPDHIVFPVGNGGLYLGAWRGFSELIATGEIDRMPRLHAVQSENISPIASEFIGDKWDIETIRPTIAGGIAVAAPARAGQVLDVLRETNGMAVMVDEVAVADMQRMLARKEGVFAEPTSAAAFAGLSMLLSEGTISKGDSVLVPVTGFGLKDEVRFSDD